MFSHRNTRKQCGSRLRLESLEERALMTTVVHDLADDFGEIGSPQNVDVWALNAGEQSLDHQMRWPTNRQPVWTALNDGEVSQFTSASDLDFEGEFVYAVNAGGPNMTPNSRPLTIGDAQFEDATISRELCWSPTVCVSLPRDVITASSRNATWYPDANYGDTTEDNNLEFIMESIRWQRAPGFSIDLEVEPGQPYKLQMLFAELAHERGFDIYIEDQEVLSDFVTYQEQGGINRKDAGVVYTREFVAADRELNIRLTGDAGVPDDNPVINAFTLEKLDGGNNAPVWLQLNNARNENEFAGFEAGDLLLRPATEGDGYGAANVTWTSPEETMISVSGGLWTMDGGTSDVQWQLALNREELSTGTLLAGEFSREKPFDLRAGNGGVESVRNILVNEGDELRLDRNRFRGGTRWPGLLDHDGFARHSTVRTE